jgi:hypothetical protein
MHASTFEYLQPTTEQIGQMARVRTAANEYCKVLERELPEGSDKIYVMRAVRSAAMWANVAITRHSDGTPRDLPTMD